MRSLTSIIFKRESAIATRFLAALQDRLRDLVTGDAAKYRNQRSAKLLHPRFKTNGFLSATVSGKVVCEIKSKLKEQPHVEIQVHAETLTEPIKPPPPKKQSLLWEDFYALLLVFYLCFLTVLL